MSALRYKTANYLFNHMRKRYPNMPITLIQEKIKRITDRRKLRGELRKANSRLRKSWLTILAPLQAHIQSVLVNQAQHQHTNPEYYKFNERYLKLLRAMRDDMKTEMRTNTMPKQSLNQANLMPKDAECVVWTDWVSHAIRDKVEASYHKLPRTDKTNYRTIFPEPKERKMSKPRLKLEVRINDAIYLAEENLKSSLLNDDGKAYYAQEIQFLQMALARLHALPTKAKTPKEYTALFTSAELTAGYPMLFKPTEGEPQ
jgi:hypothetical protein